MRGRPVQFAAARRCTPTHFGQSDPSAIQDITGTGTTQGQYSTLLHQIADAQCTVYNFVYISRQYTLYMGSLLLE